MPTKRQQPLKRQRATKIVATVGPASNSEEKLKALFLAGVDVFRLNFSHGTQENHGEVLARIRRLEKEMNRPIGVIADMQGPKLRIGRFKDGAIAIKAGDILHFDADVDRPGDETRVPIPHPDILAALNVGSTVLCDDGKVRLKVVKKGEGFLEAQVVAGTRLSNNKGFNIPDVVLPLSPLTDKDRLDLEFACEAGVEWIALSFVQRPEDIHEARALIKDRAAVMLKMEKPSAVDYLTELVELSDSIMVARGDLGVEISLAEVPALQKRMIAEARKFGRPVIVATQMLESMITAPVPTRAEVSDVATAVYEGADCVMLSAETAAGQFPVEAVTFMDDIIRHVECDPGYRQALDATQAEWGKTIGDAVTKATYQAAIAVDASALVAFTLSGTTGLRAARERPAIPILGLTPKMETARRLALSYGVHAVHMKEDIHSFGDMVDTAVRTAVEHGLGKPGDRLAITAGVPFAKPGTTNIMRITTIGADSPPSRHDADTPAVRSIKAHESKGQEKKAHGSKVHA
ncbi:pyruvate kinase [Xanthobacter sp. V7C-4]|uniref:pyruvate kinase n=1 Tax=Xanthobacter autotrophicus (strain ATCC BAA-1158 / Py2) TaxID=78245 RepID=UPI00372946FB